MPRYVRDEDGNLRDEREFFVGYTKFCTECEAELPYPRPIPDAICTACAQERRKKDGM